MKGSYNNLQCILRKYKPTYEKYRNTNQIILTKISCRFVSESQIAAYDNWHGYNVALVVTHIPKCVLIIINIVLILHDIME